MRAMIETSCSPISCLLSWLIYRKWEALCARAHAEDWRVWRAVFDRLMGEGHCRQSHEFWRE
jgi:hypothetical protein